MSREGHALTYTMYTAKIPIISATQISDADILLIIGPPEYKPNNRYGSY